MYLIWFTYIRQTGNGAWTRSWPDQPDTFRRSRSRALANVHDITCENPIDDVWTGRHPFHKCYTQLIPYQPTRQPLKESRSDIDKEIYGLNNLWPEDTSITLYQALRGRRWGRDESIGNGNHKKVMISLDDLHCRSISVAHTLITDMPGSTGRTTSRTATIHGHCPHDSTDGQALII